MISAAVQGATIGQMEAPAFGVSAKSMYVLPGGTLAQNAQDYAQANYYAMMQMGAAPGTGNWSTIQRGANQLMTMVPGMSRQGAMQAQNALQQAPVLNRAVALGMNFRPGGQMQTPEQIYQQVFNRLTMGNKIDAKTFEAMMQPGAPGAVNLQALGIDPGSDEYYGFMQYALTRLGMQKQGKVNAMGQGMPDVGTSKGAKQTPLGQTPYYSQLTAQSARSRIESQAEPALADAAKRLNDAAGELLSAATHLTGPLGELGNFITRLIPGPGGPGGMVGGALELGAGLWAGKKLYGKFKGTGGKGGGLFGGLFKRMGKGGGAVSETEGAVEDAVAGGGKKGFLGSLMDCFGCGGSGMSGNVGDLLKGGKGKLGDLWGKAKGWVRGGEEGGLRDLLGKILGKDVAKEGEKLGMQGAGATLRGGLGGIMEKIGLKGGAGLLGGLGERFAAGGALEALGVAGGPVGIAAATALTLFGPQLLKGGIGLGKDVWKAGKHGLGEMFGGGGMGGAGMGMLLGGPLGALLGGFGGKRVLHGAEDVIGGIGHGIGSVFGGLFGHHKKQTDTDGDIAALKNPPKGSALDLMMKKPDKGTVLDAFTSGKAGQAAAPMHKRGGIGGVFGDILSAIPGGTAIGGALASFFGGTPAAAQTLPGGPAGMGVAGAGGPGAAKSWTYTGATRAAAIDLSGMFATQKGSSTNTSAGSGGTGTSGSSSSSASTGAATGTPPTGNVASWIAKAMQVAGVSGPAWTNGLNLIIQHESTGNPNATNNWDSNAAAGHPSQGLMQEIPSVFQSNAMPGYNSNILDPVSNIIAGIRYIQSRYHGIANVPGVKAVAAGQQYVGYARGSQLIDRTQLALLHKGESVVTAADNYSTMPYNRNGAQGGSGPLVYLNFKSGAIVLQVPPTSSQQDMDNMAKQFVAAISKPQLLNAVRSS
jgi:hypothetical protein